MSVFYWASRKEQPNVKRLMLTDWTDERKAWDGLGPSVHSREFNSALAKLKEAGHFFVMEPSTIVQMKKELTAALKTMSHEDLILHFMLYLKGDR
jgi:hypothetical protein